VTLDKQITVLYDLLEPQTSSPASATAEPLLSVVLTVVDGGETLRRCLKALAAQSRAPAMEVLVPYDSTAEAVASIVAEARRDGSPTIRSLDLGRVDTHRPPLTSGGQHELIDRRRSAGLLAARGALVGILEDRGVPRADWATTAVRLHGELPHQVIGGAVENARERTINWAVYFCDFGRYQRPFVAGPRPYVSDVNVVYKRSALERTRDVWRERYHEPLVHWALAREGAALFASPDLVVDQMRDNLRMGPLLRERVAWGRLFGSIRARDASFGRRLGLALVSPLVPGLLFLRLLRDQLAKRASLPQFARAAPATVMLMTAWGLGEAIGVISGRS
jgi:hypothetical protein